MFVLLALYSYMTMVNIIGTDVLIYASIRVSNIQSNGQLIFRLMVNDFYHKMWYKIFCTKSIKITALKGQKAVNTISLLLSNFINFKKYISYKTHYICNKTKLLLISLPVYYLSHVLVYLHPFHFVFPRLASWFSLHLSFVASLLVVS